jgi:hypothetical protein
VTESDDEKITNFWAAVDESERKKKLEGSGGNIKEYRYIEKNSI